MADGTKVLKEAPTLELVLKRNPVERMKREKSPLSMMGELPALIATGYADIEEEDLVRLKWWGLYHDKPKIGTFMLRIKLPAGRITPEQLRAVGELSNEHGRGAGELTTRQTIQLHYLELTSLPTVFDRLRDVGLTTVGACGDAVRNLTGCPVAGLAHDELFDVTALQDEVTAFFYGNPDYSDLPRKHKISISACAHRCNAPEINCISLVGVIRNGEKGFAVLVGGGLSSVPRIARDLGVWIREDEAMPVMRALLDAWKEDLRYRISRVKARMKFMVDDRGPEGMREEVERRLGYALPDYTLEPLDHDPADHMGVELEHEPGRALDRRARSPRPHLRRPDARRRRPRRDAGPRHQADAPAEPDRDRGRRRRERDRRARRDRLPGRREPPALERDRLHRRAALQLRRRRDEGTPRHPDRAPRGPLRQRRLRAPPAPRRLPARLRPALGRRSRLPGHDRAGRRGQAPPGLRHPAARRARPAWRRSAGPSSGACRPRSSTRRSRA